MIRPRLILVIRLCFWASVCMWSESAFLMFSSFAWVPLGLFMPAPLLSGSSPCTDCIGGTQNVISVQFDIAGVANNVSQCCSNLNATFILNWNALLGGPGTEIGVCAYYLHPLLRLDKSIGQPCSQAPTLSVSFKFYWRGSAFISYSDANKAFAWLDDASSGGGEVAATSSTLTYPTDCSSGSGLSSLPFPVVNGVLPPTLTTRCDYTSATITVTP